MADALQFREITFQEAKDVVFRWHHQSNNLVDGKYFFGAESNGKLIAAAVFVDCRSKLRDGFGELIATVKEPGNKFQISRLLKYCRKQLRDKYSVLVTYCDIRHSKGGQLKGDYWNYAGITKHVTIEPGYDILFDMMALNSDYGYYLYWIPINEQGQALALAAGLENHPYPK